MCISNRRTSGAPEPVDTGHAGDYQDVAAREQRVGGRVAQLVDFVVHRRVLLDEGIGGGDIGLGLVVVVIGDEVFDRVMGEELLELD